MAEGKCRERWNHTSAMLALIANANRDPKKSRVFKPEDFHPYMGRKAAKRAKVSIDVLKDVFVRAKPPAGKERVT